MNGSTTNLMKIAFRIAFTIAMLGILFKIQHWAGGGILTALGFLTLSLTMIISGFIGLGKEDGRPVSSAERIIVGILLFGLLFKVQHWPGAGILLVVSITTLSILYFGVGWLLISPDQTKPGPFSMAGLVVGFGYSLLAIGILFKLQHWPGAMPQIYAGIITSAIAYVWHWYSVKDAEPAYEWHTETRIRLLVLVGSAVGLVLFR
jgi:hypothetical protein